MKVRARPQIRPSPLRSRRRPTFGWGIRSPYAVPSASTAARRRRQHEQTLVNQSSVDVSSTGQALDPLGDTHEESADMGTVSAGWWLCASARFHARQTRRHGAHANGEHSILRRSALPVHPLQGKGQQERQRVFHQPPTRTPRQQAPTGKDSRLDKTQGESPSERTHTPDSGTTAAARAGRERRCAGRSYRTRRHAHRGRVLRPRPSWPLSGTGARPSAQRHPVSFPHDRARI